MNINKLFLEWEMKKLSKVKALVAQKKVMVDVIPLDKETEDLLKAMRGN